MNLNLSFDGYGYLVRQINIPKYDQFLLFLANYG